MPVSAELAAQVAERRILVAELTRQGSTIQEIADQLGVTRDMVSRDREVSGVTGVARSQSMTAIAERRKLVTELTAQGWTLDQIAARLNVTPRTVARDREETGILRPYPPRFTDEEQRRAQELLDDGYSIVETARTLNRSVDTIGRRFRGQGWTLAEIGQFNSLTALRKRVLGD